MRAIYLPNQTFETEFEVTDKETLHHLNNVIRIQAGEEILLLNGLGEKYFASIKQIEKKRIQVRVNKKENCLRGHQISVLVGTPKKEYLEDIVRSCIQLGVEQLFYMETKNSPKSLKVNQERLDKIVKSSYEQSNNPFHLKITEINTISELPSFKQKFLMTLANVENTKNLDFHPEESCILAIGPEGGFSQEEESFFLTNGFQGMHLPTPILKAVEAVPAGVGCLLAALVSRS